MNTSSTPQYNISDLANEFSITTRSIRFYEEKGLLTPLREGHKRLYNSADRTRLKLILRGKRLGFSLQESREIIDLYDPSADNDQQLQALLDKIEEKRQLLQRQMQDINKMLQELNNVEQRCRQTFQNHHSQNNTDKGSPE